jgi:prevent-host-death family protein
MSDIVNINEAKTHLSQLIERVCADEEITIAKSGKPVARLAPLSAPEPRRPGLLVGIVEATYFDPLPEQELDAWER